MDDTIEIHAEGLPDQVVADISAQCKQAAVGRAELWPQLVELRDALCKDVRDLQATPPGPDSEEPGAVQVSARATVIRNDSKPELRVEHAWTETDWTP